MYGWMGKYVLFVSQYVWSGCLVEEVRFVTKANRTHKLYGMD